MTQGMDPRTKVSFEADGKTWTLQFTTNALVELEEAAGKAITELLSVEVPTLKTVRTMFWAGLIENHPELSQKDAGRVIDAAGGFEAVMEIVNRAITAAMPEAEDAEGAEAGGGKKSKAA